MSVLQEIFYTAVAFLNSLLTNVLIACSVSWNVPRSPIIKNVIAQLILSAIYDRIFHIIKFFAYPYLGSNALSF